MKLQKTLQWSISNNNESLIVELSGELTRNTLLPLWKQRASFLSCRKNQHIYWNLKALERIDSAGFVLLIELLHYYSGQTSNYLISVPNVVKTLAELYGLEQWLAPYLPH